MNEVNKSQDNPYAPPKSQLLQKGGIDNRNVLIGELKRHSTWTLVLLSIVTLGIYFAHYIRRQNIIINQHLEAKHQLSLAYANIILVFSYVSIAFLFALFQVDDYHTIDSLGNFIDTAYTVLTLIWAFKIRSRMHFLLNAEKGHLNWFHGFWTFLFTGFYLNYKVNLLHQNTP